MSDFTGDDYFVFITFTFLSSMLSFLYLFFFLLSLNTAWKASDFSGSQLYRTFHLSNLRFKV